MSIRRRQAGDFDKTARRGLRTGTPAGRARIAARVHAAVGNSRTVQNVGAGAGCYEPADRYVLAVEPSPAMRAQRPGGAAPAVDAVAERLSFDDDSFDAVMAMMTVHQWDDVEQGLREAAHMSEQRKRHGRSLRR